MQCVYMACCKASIYIHFVLILQVFHKSVWSEHRLHYGSRNCITKQYRIMCTDNENNDNVNVGENFCWLEGKTTFPMSLSKKNWA